MQQRMTYEQTLQASSLYKPVFQILCWTTLPDKILNPINFNLLAPEFYI